MSAEEASAPVAAAPAGPKKYTLTDLKENGTNKKLYMLLHDKVYDVTNFLDEHPGGDEVMLSEAGRDATEAFEDVGHSDEARELLGPMLLGEFEGVKSEKKIKTRTVSDSSSSSSASSISYFIPLAVVGTAYLIWRLYFA